MGQLLHPLRTSTPRPDGSTPRYLKGTRDETSARSRPLGIDRKRCRRSRE